MGNAVADRLGVGLIVTGGEVVTVTVGKTVVVGDTVTVGVAGGVADVPGKGLVLVVGAVPLPGVPLAVADPVTEGEKMAGVVGEEPPEHAEIPTEASTVRTPKPAAVNRVLSTVPVMGVRTFMEPPRGPGRCGPCFRIRRQKRFRILGSETVDGRKKRRRLAMACSALEY